MKSYKVLFLLIIIMLLTGCNGIIASQSTQVSSATAVIPTATAINSKTTNSVKIDFADTNDDKGITLLPNGGDSRHKLITIGGKSAVQTVGLASSEDQTTNYIYFAIKDDFYYSTPQPVTIEIQYYDEGSGPIVLEYDSTETTQPDNPSFDLAYRPVTLAYRLNTRTWKTVSYFLTDARFANRENGAADFRLHAQYVLLTIHSVTISRGGVAGPVPTARPTVFPPAVYPQPLGKRAIFTYYFYWYDALTGSHMTFLSDVPPDFQTFSFRDVNWHKKQLEDIAYAGIDAILPIYWYNEENLWWSRPGIQVLAQALEQVRQEGITPPSVGMFLDTTSSKGTDLRADDQKAHLYENIHYFFNTIPRPYWALAPGGRPVIWSYTSNWPAAYDQSFIDYIYNHFEADFGVRPYIVLESSWEYPAETKNGQQVKNTNAPHLKYDASYDWGGALAPMSTAQITSIGPGYDDHLLPDRIPPSYADRLNGETYRNGFVKATLCGTPWLAIETWNEFHEATDIAESLQYGRQYIEITHEFTQYFKDGKLPQDIQLSTNYSGASLVSVMLGENNQEAGLSLMSSGGDGQHTPVNIGGRSARQTVPMAPDAQASYLYFSVDDGFYFNNPEKINITVSYFDNGYEPIYFQYDSAKCGSLFNISKMYKQVLLAVRNNSKKWRTATVQISDATFAGNQNSSADFRLATGYTTLTVSEVKIQKIP